MSGKAEVAALFDGKADRYLARRDREYGFVVQKRLVLEMISGTGGRALEVGCGPGGLAPDLAGRGYRVVGTDLSYRMVRVAREKVGGSAVGLACADAERLCFPDGSFDLVVCMGVLEYLDAPGPAVSEIRRILRPGGEAVLTVPTSVSPSALMDRLFDRLPAGVRRALLRRPDLPSGDRVLRLPPWRLDREMKARGLVPGRRAFCYFTMFPFDRIAPRLSEALAARLEPLGRNRVTGLLGRQYVVRAVAA